MIIVHIGLRKAGSASLQAFLAANEAALRARGVDYPRIGRVGPEHRLTHVNLAHDLRGAKRYDPAYGSLEALAQAWRGSDADTMILSSEMFEDCTPDEARRLGALLRRGNEPVRIVLILRHLIDLMPSSYGQKVKYGLNTYDFDHFYASRMGQRRVNYFKTARRWAAAFGWESLSVRLLDRAFLEKGDLIDDFLAVAGLQNAGPGLAEFERPGEVNVTPGWRVLEAMRALYSGQHGLSADPFLSGAADHAPERRRLVGETAARVGDRFGWNADKGRYLTVVQARECEAVYADAIAELNRRLTEPLPPSPGLQGFTPRAALPEAALIAPGDLRSFYDTVAAETAEGAL